MEEMISVDASVESIKSAGLGFDRVHVLNGSTFEDNSTIVIIPTRGMIHYKVSQAIQNLIAPMNQKRALLYAAGDEVGVAYNNLIRYILNDPELSSWKYVLTIEDDNLVPPDTHIRLLETIKTYNFDAVGGIYFTKGDVNMPMAYGDPEEYRRTGVLDFRPRDIQECLKSGGVMEVNGIAMGCSLYRMDLFKDIKEPWFVTLADIVPEKGGAACFTQDLYFCEKAKKVGKRFAIDMRVRAGHCDVKTGIVY